MRERVQPVLTGVQPLARPRTLLELFRRLERLSIWLMLDKFLHSVAYSR